MPEEKKEEEKLKNHTIVLMAVTALFFDVLQWLLAFVFMDWLVSVFAYLTFFVWFMLHHITFMKPKRLVASLLAVLVESWPALAAVAPSFTVAVLVIALDTKVQKIAPALDIIKK